MQYVITDGGGQPNVVPPEAVVWYFVRANTHEDVEANFKWIQDIASAAAQMTQTELTSVQIDTDCHELVANTPLSELLDETLRAVGPPDFSAEEYEYGQRLHQSMTDQFGRHFTTTFNTGVEPPGQETGKASTDVGDISWRVPTGGFSATCRPDGTPGHSWQTVACIGTAWRLCGVRCDKTWRPRHRPLEIQAIIVLPVETRDGHLRP
jgi:aminobenzoyl-glutamate utilization protein B